MEDRIPLKWFYWCGVKDSVMFKVSTTHPRRIWQVDQVKSTAYIFFRDKNYFRLDVSVGSRGRNTFYSARNKMIRT